MRAQRSCRCVRCWSRRAGRSYSKTTRTPTPRRTTFKPVDTIARGGFLPPSLVAKQSSLQVCCAYLPSPPSRRGSERRGRPYMLAQAPPKAAFVKLESVLLSFLFLPLVLSCAHQRATQSLCSILLLFPSCVRTTAYKHFHNVLQSGCSPARHPPMARAPAPPPLPPSLPRPLKIMNK